MNNFCYNKKCVFHNIMVEENEVCNNKIKRYLNKINDNDEFEEDIWLCEYCTGVLELVSELVNFNRLKDGVLN